MGSDDLNVDYRSVYKAWLSFRKGKQPTGPIDRFAYGLESHLSCLSNQLVDKSYKHRLPSNFLDREEAA